jgi:hypothetical protein
VSAVRFRLWAPYLSKTYVPYNYQVYTTGDNLKHLKKRMLLVAAICTCLTGVYWLKNASGVNLFGDLSLSAYFPFSLLKLEPNVHHERGSVTIDEDFESLLPIPIKWWRLHTPAPNSIWTNYSKAGPESSRCLVVTSLSDQRWHVTHRYRMAVRENDRFYLEGMLWSKSNGGYAAVQVSGFDAQGQIIERNMWCYFDPIAARRERSGRVQVRQYPIATARIGRLKIFILQAG